MLTRRILAAVLSLLAMAGGMLAAPAPAAAAAPAMTAEEAAASLHRLGLVEGDEGGYRLSDPVTRAELAKLLVQASGYGSQAAAYGSGGTFTDTVGHWYAGGIALAHDLGLMEGYPEGEFRPEAYVSYAEAIAALARLSGVPAGSAPWPRTYLVPAKAAGIIPPDWNLDWRLDDGTSRGDLFILLARALEEGEQDAGGSQGQEDGDQTPPDLTVEPLPLETQSASLPVVGRARGAVAVQINGDDVPLVDGAFRWDCPLMVGPNTILVQASDGAGNTAEESFTVRRLPGMADNAYTEHGTMVPVGESEILPLAFPTGADAGKAEVLVSPKLGVFDPRNGVFTAGKKVGKATVTVTVDGVQYTHEVAVTPGPVEQIEVVPAEITLEPGESTQFHAVGYDAFENEVPLIDVKWSATTGEIDQEGRYEAPSGKWTTAATIRLTFGHKSATARATPLNYKVASVRLAKPKSYPRADGYTEFYLTATLADSKGKPVTDYIGDVQVESSDEDVVEVQEEDVDVVDGVAEIPLRVGEQPGIARISVTTNLGRQGVLTIPIAAQTLQSIRLQGKAEPAADGQPTGVIEAIALDQDGNPIREELGQTAIITLTLTTANENKAATFVSTGLSTADLALGEIDEETDDVRSRIYITYPAGTGTVTVEGKVKTKELSKVKVLAGAVSGDQAGRPAAVRIQSIPATEAGQERTIAVDVLDEDGYRVTQPGPLADVEVWLRDQNDVVWTATPDEGRAEFHVRQMKIGTYTYTATLEPGGQRDTATQKVITGAADSAVLTASPAVLPTDGESLITLTAELKDVGGNRISGRRYVLRFEKVTGDQAVLLDEVSTADGTGQIRLKASQVTGADRLQVRVYDPAVDPDQTGDPVTEAETILSPAS